MSQHSLLPDNRTALEQALEQSFARALQQLDSAVPALWQPQQIPHRLLPWLADAKGVDDWQGDSESARRNTVASIWPVQRQAGTRAALHAAVAGLGFNTRIERGPEPCQLHIYAELEQLWHYSHLQQRVLQRLERARSERDQIRFSLQVPFRVGLGVLVTARLQGQRHYQAVVSGRQQLQSQQGRCARLIPHRLQRQRLHGGGRQQLRNHSGPVAVLVNRPRQHYQGQIS